MHFQVTIRIVDDLKDPQAFEFVRRLPTGSLNHFWTANGNRARLTHVRIPVEVNVEGDSEPAALAAVEAAARAIGLYASPLLEVQRIDKE